VTNEKVYQMRFSKIYPLLVNKATRKGRLQAEVNEVISWLTGYSADRITELSESETTYAEFFEQAPHLNENRALITGKVCGINVEDIKEPLMREIRCLDKLIDELARGKSMDKILRK